MVQIPIQKIFALLPRRVSWFGFPPPAMILVHFASSVSSGDVVLGSLMYFKTIKQEPVEIQGSGL